jgi:hypothetical protein
MATKKEHQAVVNESEKASEATISENSSTLTRIQNEINAPKNLYNSFGKYNYRNVESIQFALKPLLLKYGATCFVTDEIEFIGNRFYVVATATLSDAENTWTTKAYAREEDAKKGMDGAQITGGSSSYARKYALGGLLLIDDAAGDPDSTNTHGKEQQQPSAPPQPQNNMAQEQFNQQLNAALQKIAPMTFDQAIEYSKSVPQEVKSSAQYRKAVSDKRSANA